MKTQAMMKTATMGPNKILMAQLEMSFPASCTSFSTSLAALSTGSLISSRALSGTKKTLRALERTLPGWKPKTVPLFVVALKESSPPRRQD